MRLFAALALIGGVATIALGAYFSDTTQTMNLLNGSIVITFPTVCWYGLCSIVFGIGAAMDSK